MRKILNIFGYYSFNQIADAAAKTKTQSDLLQYDLSQRIQQSYYHPDNVELNKIATEVVSMNPVGEFITNLVTNNS